MTKVELMGTKGLWAIESFTRTQGVGRWQLSRQLADTTIKLRYELQEES
jgi:hypothetical protein